MPQQSPPPLRSITERRAVNAPVPLPEVPVNGSPPEDGVEELRRLAQAQGYRVSRQSRPRRARPDSRGGRVMTTCRLAPSVREAMEQARWQLNLTYADMINAGVVMFLRSQNLRVEVDPEELPSLRDLLP